MRDRLNIQTEDGFSLAEILVTIVIVGITFTALLGGLVTSITVSGFHRQVATADALTRSAGEWVKDSVQTPYDTTCASDPYSLSGLSVPTGFSVAIVSVEYWDGIGPSSGAYSPAFVSSCPGTDKGMQRITVRASSTDGKAIETVQVIKRNVP
jgi:prepilin-type N-terminal cleavage/methylation domain-containing protein